MVTKNLSCVFMRGLVRATHFLMQKERKVLMKKIISLFTAFCIVISMLCTFTVFADETTEISTIAELEAFRDSVNSGNTYEGKTVKLTADINMSEKYGADINGEEISWTPISDFDNPFNGTFDGRGHALSGLYINSEYMDLAGLFGYCTENSQILNLTVDGSITVGFPDDGYWANPPSWIGGKKVWLVNGEYTNDIVISVQMDYIIHID